MPLKHRQAWGIDQPSWRTVPVSDHAKKLKKCKEMLPKAQSEPVLVQLWTIPTHPPVTGYQGSRSQHCPLYFPSSESCREQWDTPTSSLVLIWGVDSEWTLDATKAVLSLPSSEGWGRENKMKGSWLGIRVGRDHSAITVTGRTDSTWKKFNSLSIKPK